MKKLYITSEKGVWLYLRKMFLKDWGKKCRQFSCLCGNCNAWHSLETLEDLYEIRKGGIKAFKKCAKNIKLN